MVAKNVKVLVPPSCPRTLEVIPILDQLMAAERAIASTAAVAKLLPHPDLITRSLERREAVLSSQIEGTRTDLTQLLEYECPGRGASPVAWWQQRGLPVADA